MKPSLPNQKIHAMGQTFLEFTFTPDPLQPAVDILIAELSEIGFESFVEKETSLVGYINEKDFNEEQFLELYVLQTGDFQITYTTKSVAQQNWNAEWEKSFDPIYIGEDCAVRAPFHKVRPVTYDIVIEPKMSFGTGHHETTHMMLQHLLETDISGKSVLDMGCGTGVLAILAAKKGAAQIDAVDIDNWCFKNSVENAARNDCPQIQVFEGDASYLKNKMYDIIIANINRNILLEDIPTYASCLKKGGQLFLSGFYLSDLKMISAKCEASGLQFLKKIEKNNWVAVKYVH